MLLCEMISENLSVTAYICLTLFCASFSCDEYIIGRVNVFSHYAHALTTSLMKWLNVSPGSGVFMNVSPMRKPR